jgi:LacI family transcriptional regulator
MTDRSNIRDVAKLAGVAVKTVSRVLNNHPYVSTATKAKVDAAMAELRFSYWQVQNRDRSR